MKMDYNDLLLTETLIKMTSTYFLFRQELPLQLKTRKLMNPRLV